MPQASKQAPWRLQIVLERQHERLLRVNGELNAAHAEVNSPELMMERAAYLGFRPALPDEIQYRPVEGYVNSEAFVAPLPPSSDEDRQSVLSPSYTETLGEWLSRLALGIDP